MSNSKWNPFDILPIFMLLAFGGQDIDSLMRKLISLVTGVQNTINAMQTGVNTFNQGVTHLMVPQSNAPQGQPGAYQPSPTTADQTTVEETNVTQPLETFADEPEPLAQPHKIEVEIENNAESTSKVLPAEISHPEDN